MATCRVQRNDNGRITKVNDENGVESQLYNAIAKHPMIQNDEEALGVFKNTLTDKVGDNPSFTHRVDGELVSSYKKALQKAKEGDLIEIGFETADGFTSVISINKTTDRGTQEGFINNMIQNGILSENKKWTRNGYKFQSEGNSENAKIVNAELLRDEARAYLGTRGVGKDGTTFDLHKTNDKYRIIDHDGVLTEVSKEEIDGMTYEELQKITPYALDYITAREYAKKPAYGFAQDDITLPSRSEEELQVLLLNFLNKLGVSTMSISDYVEKYNIKNGVDPSANALADIANKVVAFHEGKMGLEALTEEVAHFINEAMPQEEVEGILRGIHKSDEWNEHAEAYRDIYSKRYEGEALENAVRREVLGKVVANSILNNFNTEGKNARQTNFISQALHVVTRFFEKVAAYFQPQHRTQLDSYLNSVEEILRADDISNSLNTDNFEGNNLVLYNMSGKVGTKKSTIKLSAEKAIMSLRDQIQSSLARAKKSSSINKQKLQDIQEKLENAEEMSAVADINALANTYITMLDKAIDDAEKNNKSYIFTQEENIIFQALKTQLIPSLGEIRSIISEKKEDKTAWRDLDGSLETTISRSATLAGRASRQESGAIRNMVDRIMMRHELPESSRDYIERWIDSAESDTNWFHANFGMLTHSKDGLLNLAGMLQKDMATQSNIRWQDSTKRYQQRLKELGISEKEISQFVDGNFIVSEYDFNKFENVIQRMEANLYKEISGSDLSIQDIIDKKKDRSLEPLDSAQELELKRRLRNLRNPLLERKFNSEYYDQFENKLSDLGISQAGIRYLTNFYSDMSQFKRAARRKIGDRVVMDFSQLSEQDKALREKILIDRNNAKSYYTENGRLKEGLELNEQGEVVGTDDVSEDAQIALDLNKLDDPANRDESLNTETSGMPQVFMDTLREIDENEGREAALEFLFMNSFVGFTQEYWDSMDVDNNNSILSKLERANEAEENPKIQELLEDIREERSKLKSILKVYRSKNNPSEINVDAMPRATRDTVKTIQQGLASLYRQSREFTKNIETEEGEGGTINAVSSVNDAYFNKLEDLGLDIDFDVDSLEEVDRKLKEEIEFASEHMTEGNREEMNIAMKSFNRYRSGNRSTVHPIIERKLEELGMELKDFESAGLANLQDDQQNYVRVIQAIARDRLLPYYTRFAPTQYNEFMREITTGEGNLADIVPNALERNNYMEINPNYSFFDDTQNKNMNPNYVEDFDGGYLQPKKDISQKDVDNIVAGIADKDESNAIRKMLQEGGNGFRSSKYNELFGSNPSGNLYEAYQATLDYNKESLEAMGVGNSYNMFTLPQVKKNRMERFSKFTRGASLGQIQEALNEEFTYTEDDKIQGESTKFGDSIKIIPKMYTDRIENPDDVSNELFYSLTLRAKEAYLREARVQHYGDFMAIYDKIVNRSYGQNVKPENTLKMFESAMDYSLFGVKETAMYPIKTMFGTIDIAKLARQLLGFIKFRNLGLNLIIPITSYLTGRTTREMEKWIGEHMDKRSQVLGDNEFRKHAREAIGEIGQVNTDAKLNVLGQYFGAFDMAESFRNSNYGYLMRNLPRTGMMMHTGANFPLYASTMLGVLHDYRVINGSIMRFNQFERQKSSEGLSKEEIKNEWNKTEDDAIYNYIKVENAEVSFKDDSIRDKVLNKDGERMSEEEFQEFKNEKIQAIRGHISNVITNIDGQIPNEARVHAQRHFALNYFMTHRGWLSIVASRRFKNRHLNVETGEHEEGSYRTVWNFMGRYFKELKKNNFKTFVKSWKDIYDNVEGRQLANEVQILAKSKGSNQDKVRKIQDLFKETELDITKYKLDENNIEEVTDKIVSDIKNSSESALVRKNMKRVGIEMAALNTLMLFAFLLNGLADDDEFEDNYGIQGLSYLSNRGVNELVSSQTGSVNNFFDVIESPFVGWNTVTSMMNMGDLFSGEEVTHGTYRGLSERQRYLTKLVPGAKQIYDLSDTGRVKQMRDTYMFYNRSNYNYTPLGNLYWLADES